MSDDPRLDTVAELSAAIGREIDSRDPAAVIGWPELPDVAAMVDHLGFIHRWVTAVLLTGRAVPDAAVPVEHGSDVRGWYDEGRAALLRALSESAVDAPCWVLGSAPRVAGFWRRRMVFEHVKHLTDLRAAGGGAWTVAPELTPAQYADGIDELFEVMLPRSRSTLPTLAGPVALEATDTGDVWRIGADWSLLDEVGGAVRVLAPAGDLAMAVWERADPVREPVRFRIEGDREVAAAFFATSIHPW